MYYIGNNHLVCRGLLVFGPKPFAAFVTFCLVNVPVTVFSILTTRVRHLINFSSFGREKQFGNLTWFLFGGCRSQPQLFCCSQRPRTLALCLLRNGTVCRPSTLMQAKLTRSAMPSHCSKTAPHGFNSNFVKLASFSDRPARLTALSATTAFLNSTTTAYGWAPASANATITSSSASLLLSQA